MATLTVKDMRGAFRDFDPAGADFEAAAGAGDQVLFPVDGNLFLVFDSGTTPSTITIDSVTPCDQGEDHNITLALGANETKGRKIPPRCKDANGYVQISYTAATDIKVLALKG